MSSFFLTHATEGVALSYTYNPFLVLFSVIVAIISSVLALQVAGVARHTDKPHLRQLALISGSLALGGGIWSMHFIGMLAVSAGVHIHYDPLITLLSIFPSVFASWVALHMLSTKRVELHQLFSGGALVGAGIGAMHYSGMAAMQTDGQLVYEPYTFALSIVAAVVLAIFSLGVNVKLTEDNRLKPITISLLSGALMGMAITAMHYLGMVASRIYVTHEHVHQATNTHHVSTLVIQIGLITLAMSMAVFVMNLLLRYREVNAQLAASESKLRALVETAVDGIIAIDAKGHILTMNDAAQQLFGWSSDDVVGKNITLLMPDPFHSEHDDYIANYLNTGIQKIIGVGREVTAKRKDGTLVPIRLAVGRADIDGEPLFVGFVTDISERIHMQREILARETQYRTLIGNIPGVAFRCEAVAPWKTLFISDAITTLAGWSPALFTDHDLCLSDLTHPDDVDAVHEAIRTSAITGDPYTIEYRLIDRFQQEHWVSKSACVVRDPDSRSAWIDGVIIDITETKKRNAEFEGIVRSIGRSLLFFEFDLTGRVIDANDNFLTLMGYRKNDIVQLRHDDLLCFDGRSNFGQDDFWDALMKGYFHMGEYCLKGFQGRRIWMQASFNPILNSDGKPWKIVALGNDISHRKAMETDLFIAKNKAEQASNAKGLFLANMSHEIRTPMNAILGFTDLLLDSPLNDVQKKHLKTIAQSGRSLLGLLNDILDTAKLERGALDLALDTFSLRDLTQQILQEQSAHAQKKFLMLTLDYPNEIRDFVLGDVLRVKQILVNLVGNAVKFTEKGEVVLRVRERGDNIVFKIVDSGIGIPSDRLTHIFTPFTQADASMARRFGGTGLGTTIARQLTELMGGTITAASVEGKGSTFTVDIPLPATEAPLVTQEAPTLSLPPLRVLIADDVPENLELLDILLRRDGHDVVSAPDGLTAFNLFTQQHFDVVLMDIQMPGMDGLESTAHIRTWERDQQRSPTPVIALTASVLERDRAKAAEAGMNGFASKPVNVQELYTEIAIQLGLYEPLEPTFSVDVPARAIDWQGAINRWGDKEPLLRGIHKLTGEIALYMQSPTWGEGDDFAQRCHRFKGVAANLGLLELQYLLGELEYQRLSPLSAIPPLRAALEQITRELLEQGYAEQQEREATGELKTLCPILLKTLRDEFAQGAVNDDLIAQAKSMLDAARFEQLQRVVDEFDLDSAASLIDSWLRDISALEATHAE